MCKWLMAVVCVSLASVSASSAEPAEKQGAPRPAKPNIVLLLTDDLGWQDVKCYDIDEPSPMETPNIDALAKKGVMFWQAYSPAPVCAPCCSAGSVLLADTDASDTQINGINHLHIDLFFISFKIC